MQVTGRYLEAWVTPRPRICWLGAEPGGLGWCLLLALLPWSLSKPSCFQQPIWGHCPEHPQDSNTSSSWHFPTSHPCQAPAGFPEVPGMQQCEYIPVLTAFLTTVKESSRAPVLTGKNNFHRRQNSSCTPELETIQGGIFDFPKLSFRNNPSSFIKAVKRGMSYLEGLTLYV